MDLRLLRKRRIASLAESVEFESEEYREKLETLKESYFPSKGLSNAKTETLTEGEEIHQISSILINGCLSQTLSAFKQN